MIPGLGDVSAPAGTGHSLEGGDATALTGDQYNSAKMDHLATLGDFGNISNGGITVNESFKFDSKNPFHIGGAVVVSLALLAYFAKVTKSWIGKK